MKAKNNSGFGLVQLLIGAGIMAGVLMILAQYMVNVKDQQKVQREKLAFLEIVRQINEVIERPVSCFCNFRGLKSDSKIVIIEEIKIFAEEDCSNELKVVASQKEKYDGVTLSMKMDNFRETMESEFLADFHISGSANRKNFNFTRTMRFSAVTDSSGGVRQTCEY